jgi:hypothetical protein
MDCNRWYIRFEYVLGYEHLLCVTIVCINIFIEAIEQGTLHATGEGSQAADIMVHVADSQSLAV